MAETYRDNRRKPKPRFRQSVRLFVEELEGRCLLSGFVNSFGFSGLPMGLIPGPDGNLWFSDYRGIGRINPATGIIEEFVPPHSNSSNSETGGIAVGPDGNIWFAEYSQIGSFNPITQTFKFFDLPHGFWSTEELIRAFGDPQTNDDTRYNYALGGQITAGPDGNIWFVESDHWVGQLNPTTGAIREFTLTGNKVGDPTLGQIIAGPDGNLWFTESREIGRINPTTGVMQGFLPVDDGLLRGGITAGPDGNLWFTNFYGGLGWINPTTGQMGRLNLPVGSVGEVIAGPDGSLWFPVGSFGGIARYNPSTGDFQVYGWDNDVSGGAITVGPDGNIWFTGFGGLGEIVLPKTLTGTGKAISGTAGVNFSGVLASFKDLSGLPSGYTATIEWGDNYESMWGDTSAGVVTANSSGGFDITGSHTFAEPGTFTVRVTVSKTDSSTGLADSISFFSTITIQAADFKPFN